MVKHSRYVISTCDHDMRYPELHKKHGNKNEDIIMHILPKDEAVRAA